MIKKSTSSESLEEALAKNADSKDHAPSALSVAKKFTVPAKITKNQSSKNRASLPLEHLRSDTFKDSINPSTYGQLFHGL